MSSKTLIKNGYIVTMDARRQVFPGGFVCIDGDRIAEVGPSGARWPDAAFDQAVDATGAIVIPGLINMHQHPWYNLFKGLSEGCKISDWWTNFFWPLTTRVMDPADVRASSYLAGLEMVRTGTTCFLNHIVTDTDEPMIAAFAESFGEVGLRQVLAKELRPHHMEAIQAVESLVRRWDGWRGGMLHMALAIEVNARWRNAGTTNDEVVTRGTRLARDAGLCITSHAGAGPGQRDVTYLNSLGVLESRWILAHGSGLTDEDIHMVADSGATVVSCPTAEAFRGSGVARIPELRLAGANVALGTDGPMVDYSVDMLEQTKACSLIQNLLNSDARAVDAEAALAMATINAAKALGLADELGSIEAGKKADIAVFNLDPPYSAVVNKPISSLVYSAKATDVSTVLVNGTIVFRDGRFSTISEERERQIIREAEERSRRIQMNI